MKNLLPLALSALALVVAPALAERAFAQEAWHYTIGQVRANQQANFCDELGDVHDLEHIFNRFGPLTGYTALSASPGCRVAVKSFTPHRIVTQVIISEGEPGEYALKFVEVRDREGRTAYLVTTRRIVEH